MPSVRAKPGTRCSVPGCTMEVVVKGMCWGHYRRVREGNLVSVSLAVPPGGKRSRAIKYGPVRPSYAEIRKRVMRLHLAAEKVTPEPNTGCWFWLGNVFPSGYGQIGNSRDPWGGYAHRAVVHFAGIDLPKGRKFHVRHTCDNGHLGCVNPDHLILGTAAENMADRDRRGRGRRGARSSWPAPRTVCRRGHACGYRVTAAGNRYCVECDAIRHATYLQRRRNRAA